MVADVDWESGLRVWRLFNNFPHPIPSQPEMCLSREDLVDVVIMNNLPAKKEKEEKKYKKGGNWKKKKKEFTKQDENNRHADLMRENNSHLESADEKDSKTVISENNSHLTSSKLVNTYLEKKVEMKDLDLIKIKEGEHLDGTKMRSVHSKHQFEIDLSYSEDKFYDENKEINAGVNGTCKIKEISDEIKVFDISNIEVKCLDETKVNNTDVKCPDETKVNNIEVKCPDETIVNSIEVKCHDETTESNIEANCLHEMTGSNTELKCHDETTGSIFEANCLDEMTGSNTELKCHDETTGSNIGAKCLDKMTGSNAELKCHDETTGSNNELKCHDGTIESYFEVKCPDKTEIITKIKYPLDVNIDETKCFGDRIVRTEEIFHKNYTQEPKTVIIKQREDWDKDTKIDIKVLLPNPDENIFPAKLIDKDDRNVEPMDLDLSVSNVSTIGECADNFKNDLKSSKTPRNIEPSFDRIIQEKWLSSISENEFATSVIEKLITPSSSLEKKLESKSSPKNIVTPPPTPTHFVTPITGLSLLKDESILELAPMIEPVLVNEEFDKNKINASCKTSLDPNSVVLKCSEEDFNKDIVSSNINKTAVENQSKPKFRVTCNRNGESHPFNSPSAAASFGSAISKYHKWIVDLNNFDIEVLLDIDHEEVSVSIGLTKMSLHKRNMVAFGPTTLRATICYNMLRLCRIKCGDIICDPMCGSGAIPVEGGMNWVNSYHLGGDYHDKAIEKTSLNVTAIQEKNINGLKIDVVQWNIEHFPLRDKCVDVFISDLPFGHRLGNRAANRTLYPCLLTEMARTATTGARACLLTEDKGNFIRAINSLSKLWQRRLVLNINIGGLSGFVFLLSRTSVSIRSHLNYWKETTSNNNETDLGSGDCGQMSVDAIKPDSLQLLPDKTSHIVIDSGLENSEPSSSEGNLFC
ncbi:THUMP domain-containing protein 3 [Bulinus truncatus]|nr:THUMP domain-containing protein 3 [Bulinus truncatus]